MFTRAFGVFRNFIMRGRCPAPKRRALPTAPHPEVWKILNFKSFCKWSNLWSDRFFVWVLGKRICEKVSIYKFFWAFGKPATENCLHAPKPGALPTALHPVMRRHLQACHLFAMLRPQAFLIITAQEQKVKSILPVFPKSYAKLLHRSLLFPFLSPRPQKIKKFFDLFAKKTWQITFYLV